MAKCVSDVACAWAWHQPATNMHFNVGRTAKYGARMITHWNKDHNEKQLHHADSVARQNKNHAKLMRATTKSIVWPGTAKKKKHTELKTTQFCHSAHDTHLRKSVHLCFDIAHNNKMCAHANWHPTRLAVTCILEKRVFRNSVYLPLYLDLPL